MITPEKHLDLNLCVIRAGAELLSFLHRERVASVARLRDRLVRSMGPDANVIFQASINFLFLVGRIEYHPEADRIEYLEMARSTILNEGGATP
jgi:hypothetical protein